MTVVVHKTCWRCGEPWLTKEPWEPICDDCYPLAVAEAERLRAEQGAPEQ